MRTFLLGLLAAALLLASPAHSVQAADQDSGHCYALLIGINKYADKNDPPVNDLACTAADCEMIKGLLPKLTGIAAADTTLRELYDEQAVKPNILAVLDEYAEEAGPADTLFIYYSGHGVLVPDFSGDEPAGDGALVLHDFAREKRPPTAAEVGAGALIDDEMADILRRFALCRRVFYIADCCNSGGNEKAVGLVDKGFDLPLTAEQQRNAGTKAIVLLPDANKLSQGNIVAVFASDSRHKAQEIRSAGHGAMTLCLSQLLADPAAYDADGDGTLELDELSAGLRSLVDSTVRSYSNGAIYQVSFVKALDPQVWSLPVGQRGTDLPQAAAPELHGVPQEELDKLITLVEQRTNARYNAGNEPYKLLDFQFLNEDGSARADNVFLESELTNELGQPQTTLRWQFTLDAPADVLAVIVFTTGEKYLAFPNDPKNVATYATQGVTGGWRVDKFPFAVPLPKYFGPDFFGIQMSEQGWEYVVLICSPVALEDPYSQSGTAFDLLYPFDLLKNKGMAQAAGVDLDPGKGFGPATGGISGQAAPDPTREIIAPEKKLTILYQKYWLRK